MQTVIDKDKQRIRILVIEDEDYPRECISGFLELAGYSTFRAANGREGVEIFGRHQPDLILTDIKMPEMDGLDILKFMKSYSADTPVIVISGTDSLSDVAQCLKLGAWDYIIKPVYDYGVVDIAIQRALEKKLLIEENKRYKDYLEEEIIKRSDELLSYTVRFKTLFNLAGDALFIHDEDGRIIDCNDAAAKHLGYRRKELLEMNMHDLIAAEDIPLFARIMTRLPQKNNIVYDLRFTPRGGETTAMELHSTMITTDATPIVFVICRDITERRRSEQSREKNVQNDNDESGQLQHGKKDAGNKHVLVVTCSLDTAGVMDEMFSRRGVNAKRFRDPAHALEWMKVNAGATAAVIVDLDLPRFNEKDFADAVEEIAPGTLIVKILSKDQITLGSNKNLAAYADTPLNSEKFFESLTAYVRGSAVSG